MILGIELSAGPAASASQFAWMRTAAAMAESTGFGLIAPPSQRWLGEPQRLQPIQTMAALAAETQAVMLSTGMLLVAAGNPVDLSEQIVTLDHASGGRTLVEVRLAAEPGEVAPFGVAQLDVAERTIEAIDLWRRLWSEDIVDHEGVFFRVPGAKPTLRPFRGEAPLIVAAVDELAQVRLAAEHRMGVSIDAAATGLADAAGWVALLRSEVSDAPVVVRVDAASPSELGERLDALAALGCSHVIVRARAATEDWDTAAQHCQQVFSRWLGGRRP